MKSIISLSLALILSLSFLSACGSNDTTSSAPSNSFEEDIFSESYATDTEDEFTEENNTVGNTAANLANGGYFTRQGKLLYYRNEDMNCQLTCMGTDCTSPELMTTQVTMVNNINAVGENIYFSSDNGGIYTVKTDKSEFTKLIDGACVYLVATTDRLIYALDENGIISVYSSNLDGSAPITLKSSTGLSGNFAYENGRLYYSFNQGENVKDYVCYVAVDGSESGSAYSSYCEKFLILNSKIYAYFDGSLTVTSLSDSTDSKTIPNVNVNCMNTDGNDLYYTDADNGNLYKLTLSDSAVTKLNNYSCSNISLFANHIFYSQTSSVNPSGYCHWRMRTDGTFDAKRVFAIF